MFTHHHDAISDERLNIAECVHRSAKMTAMVHQRILRGTSKAHQSQSNVYGGTNGLFLGPNSRAFG